MEVRKPLITFIGEIIGEIIKQFIGEIIKQLELREIQSDNMKFKHLHG